MIVMVKHGITLQLNTASVSCLATSSPSSPAAFSISPMMPAGPAVWGPLIAWHHKFNIKQPSIVLNPSLPLILVSEQKLTSIITYAILITNVLVCAVHLFGDTGNTITVWRYFGEILFLCLRLSNRDSLIWHMRLVSWYPYRQPRPLHCDNNSLQTSLNPVKYIPFLNHSHKLKNYQTVTYVERCNYYQPKLPRVLR